MSDAPPLGVTMVRCATLLLTWGRTRLLTDPWFAMHLRGLPCFRRPGLAPEDLPPLDAVLASHLHPDHFESPALDRLRRSPGRVILPPGGLARLGRAAAPGWEELAPWTATRVNGVDIAAVPGPHTGPGPDEVNYVLRFPGWGTVFFGGDARLDRAVLAAVADHHGPVRLALLPVGGTRIFGRRTVMSPADALAAAGILGAGTVIPIHEGGIWMSVPPLSLHPGRARHLARAAGDSREVVVLREGEARLFR